MWKADTVKAKAAELFGTREPSESLAKLAEDSRALSAKAGRGDVIGLVAPVYWRLAGEADPIPGKTPKARRNALRKRREAGTRFEILQASYGAALGRTKPASRSEVEDALREAGLDPETSYTGRGTKRSAAGEAARTVRNA